MILAKGVTSRPNGSDPAIAFLAGLVPLLELGLIEHSRLRIARCFFSPATRRSPALGDRASRFANACLGTGGREAPRRTISTLELATSFKLATATDWLAKCFCPRCRVIRLRPMSWLPRISLGLTLGALARRLRCAECGGPLQSVKPWRQTDASGKAWG